MGKHTTLRVNPALEAKLTAYANDRRIGFSTAIKELAEIGLEASHSGENSTAIAAAVDLNTRLLVEGVYILRAVASKTLGTENLKVIQGQARRYLDDNYIKKVAA